MKINKDSLSMKAKSIAKEKGISINVVYSRYFFNCFLKRLSFSPYSEKFVLKGGLFLSSMLGIENRFTMDIDFILRKIHMDHDSVIDIMKEICQESADDNVIFQYMGDSEIKKDDIYGGFSVSIEGRLENVKQRFDIDLATADTVYPKDCDYEYQCLITGETIHLKTYSVESVIAEKMQTFLLKGILNSRTKDLYDIYVLERFVKKNDESLKEAFRETCQNRRFEIDRENAMKILKSIESNVTQKKRWETYAKKMSFARNVSFDEVIVSIKHLLEVML